MSMLITTMSSQVLAANEVLGAKVLTANKFDDNGGGDELNNRSKCVESKGKKSAKSKRPSKSENSPYFGVTELGPSFLTPEARSAFNRLWLAIIKASILWHFDPEDHIRIKTDASDYAIGGVLSQLASGTNPDEVVTKTKLGQWHPVVFFFRKMIPAETWYETHNSELLAIVKDFKMWRHYLEGYKHEVLVFTDHNNLRRFMDTKNLSSR